MLHLYVGMTSMDQMDRRCKQAEDLAALVVNI